MTRLLQIFVILISLACLGAVPEPAQTYPNTEPSQILAGGAVTRPAQSTVGLIATPQIRPVFDLTMIQNVTPYDARFRFPEYPGSMKARTEPGGRFNANYPNLPISEDSYFIGGWAGPRQEIDEAKLRLFARQLLPNSLFVLEIENLDCYWDGTLEDNRTVESNVRRLLQQIRIIREEAPTVQIGVYDLAPAYQFYIPLNLEYGLIAHNTNTSTLDGLTTAYWRSQYAVALTQFNGWRRANDRMTYGYRDDGTINWRGGLVDGLNFLAPSIYMVSDDSRDDNLGNVYDYAHDTAMVKWIMREAKRISGGKPVYPFVWRYLSSGPTPNNARGISQLQRWDNLVHAIADAGADGIIVWGPMEDAATRNETLNVVFKYFDRVYEKNVTPTTQP